MRINLQCESCGQPVTIQTADGIGIVGVTITCPCGVAPMHYDLQTPEPESNVLQAVAQEKVKGNAHPV